MILDHSLTICAKLREVGAAIPMEMSRVTVRHAIGSYDVHIGAGVRDQLRVITHSLHDARRFFVISDETVFRLHSHSITGILETTGHFEIQPGEASKSITVAARLYDELANARIGRHDAIIALGGGVVGDLAGFVAATWNRGIRFIQIPTTVEAAIDSSVGGKTGVNHPAGKNLIGAFHAPAAVLIDLDFLQTLPPRDYSAGLAESVKHAALRDPGFFAWQESHAKDILAHDQAVLGELITRNVAIKAGVVAADEREANLRAILNYGHTIGHAIEQLAAYKLRHGECVSLGIIAENTIAVERGLLSSSDADRITGLLRALGLPTSLPPALHSEMGNADLVAACHMDKKARGAAIHFALVARIGQPIEAADISDEEIVAAAASLRESTEKKWG